MSTLQKAMGQSKVSTEDLLRMESLDDRRKKIREMSEHLRSILSPQELYGNPELSRIDQVKLGYRTAAKIIALKKRLNADPNELPVIDFMPNFEVPGTVSILMVRPILDVLGSDEQKKHWLPLIDTGRVIGAYAQTELGHGSDVQGIETEAVYDPNTKEFVINSPSVSSYKWWPGELGHLSNMVILFAKVILNGKRIGIFPIIVQTRDMTTHKLLPNVEVGDIGPKYGYAAKENGFMKFTGMRVPKDNMLSRFFEINGEGEFQLNGDPKIIYSAMMNVRTFLLISSAMILAKGSLIAIRYSHLRTQFKDEMKVEIPVIQYQLQQFKLYPLLAKVYVMKFGFVEIESRIKALTEEVKNDDFRNLQECHILLCGAKAMYTWWANSGLYTCMQCCGGHGYSQYSGIPSMIQSFTPTSILEGENSMLCMQVAQHVLKCYKHLSESKTEKLSGSLDYFKGKERLLAMEFKQLPTKVGPEFFMAIFQKGVLILAEKLRSTIYNSGNSHSVYTMINQKQSIRLFELAKLHITAFSLQFFIDRLKLSQHLETKTVLENLSCLFAIESLLEHSSALLSVDVLSSELIATCKAHFEALLERIHPEALSLAEANIPSDLMLFSALADRNEQPYHNLYNLAKEYSMMNKVDLSGFYLETIRKASLEAYPQPKL